MKTTGTHESANTEPTRAQLRSRYNDLERMRHALECSDDSLFINANGNYPMYVAWGEEMKEISDKLNPRRS